MLRVRTSDRSGETTPRGRWSLSRLLQRQPACELRSLRSPRDTQRAHLGWGAAVWPLRAAQATLLALQTD
jgi:hypothetical protein